MRDPDDPNTAPGSAAPSRVGRLKQRADFLRAAKGRRWHGKAFSLQAAPRPPDGEAGSDARPRVGFTLTKKVGCAVVRNRARRRLREAVRLAPDLPVAPSHDYVIVGRLEALRLPFKTLTTDLARAVRGIHAEARPRDAAPRPQRTRPRP